MQSQDWKCVGICLVGYSPWGCKELDRTEQLSTWVNKPPLLCPVCGKSCFFPKQLEGVRREEKKVENEGGREGGREGAGFCWWWRCEPFSLILHTYPHVYTHILIFSKECNVCMFCRQESYRPCTTVIWGCFRALSRSYLSTAEWRNLFHFTSMRETLFNQKQVTRILHITQVNSKRTPWQLEERWGKQDSAQLRKEGWRDAPINRIHGCSQAHKYSRHQCFPEHSTLKHSNNWYSLGLKQTLVLTYTEPEKEQYGPLQHREPGSLKSMGCGWRKGEFRRREMLTEKTLWITRAEEEELENEVKFHVVIACSLLSILMPKLIISINSRALVSIILKKSFHYLYKTLS